jgi:hypothetical protein
MTEQEALMLAQAGIDGSGTLLIDADTRSIYIPESEKFFGVESDQNVERKKFKCPKIVGDNIDLSTLHLYINYQNGNGNKDSYMIQDMAVSGDYITFSWVLSRNVAAYKGTVRFVFCAKKADSSGNLVNEWNTTVAEGEVIEGLEATTTVADNNPDIIEQMLTLLENVSDEPVFTEARTRENVTNGDKVPVLWGKVKKWFADLGTAAFCKVVNNLTTAAEGGVLDARQGKELNDALAKLNKLMGSADISGIGNGTVTGALLTLNSKQSKTVSVSNATTIQELVNSATGGTNILFHLAGAGYTGSDLPNDEKYKYGSGIVFYRNSGSCKIVLIPEELKPVWKMSTWTKWKDFANNIVD